MIVIGAPSKFIGFRRFNVGGDKFTTFSIFFVAFMFTKATNFRKTLLKCEDFDSYIVERESQIRHSEALKDDMVISNLRLNNSVLKEKCDRLSKENGRYYSSFANLKYACDEMVDLYTDLEVDSIK